MKKKVTRKLVRRKRKSKPALERFELFELTMKENIFMLSPELTAYLQAGADQFSATFTVTTEAAPVPPVSETVKFAPGTPPTPVTP